MRVRDLKQQLAQLPADCDNVELVGDCGTVPLRLELTPGYWDPANHHWQDTSFSCPSVAGGTPFRAVYVEVRRD
jgi:hypothetical protein